MALHTACATSYFSFTSAYNNLPTHTASNKNLAQATHWNSGQTICQKHYENL